MNSISGMLVTFYLQFINLCSQPSCKVSIAIDSQVKSKVSQLEFLDENVLLAGTPLSRIFPKPGPTQETLHIVARLPLACNYFFLAPAANVHLLQIGVLSNVLA